MTAPYNRLPTGFKRLILVGFLGFIIYVAFTLQSTWGLVEKLLFLLIVAVIYWVAALILAWIIDAFR